MLIIKTFNCIDVAPFTCWCFLLQTIEDLEKRVKDANIEIVVRTSFLTDPKNAVHNLKVSAFFIYRCIR